jgi:hypothetical protein
MGKVICNSTVKLWVIRFVTPFIASQVTRLSSGYGLACFFALRILFQFFLRLVVFCFPDGTGDSGGAVAYFIYLIINALKCYNRRLLPATILS